MTSGRAQLVRPTALVFIILCVIILCVVVLTICDLAARAHGFVPPPIFWVVPGYAIGVVCYELGHLLCAAIGSIPVRLIVVGAGPLLWRNRFGEAWLEVRLLPFSGFVSLYPVIDYGWYRWVLFSLGGVLGNAAVICLVAAVDAAGGIPNQAGHVPSVIIFMQVFMIVWNLIPCWLWFTMSGTRMETDGLQFLGLLPRGREDPEQTHAAYATLLSGYSNGGLLPAMTLASSRILYHVGCVDRATDEDDRRDSREALLRELEEGDLRPEEKMAVLDALITEGLISGDPEFRSHLDAWSLRALELGPDVPTLVGSRGAVLVELGQYEAGKALLAPLANADEASPFCSLMSQAFLARAERALGNEAAAQQFASAARAIAEANQTSSRVMATLARLETEMPPRG